MGNNWRDRDFHHREEGISFPFIQVVHQPGQIDPRPEFGGLYQPDKEAEAAGAKIPGVVAKFHCGGGPIEGTFAPSLEIAMLKTREMLVAGRGENQRRVAEFAPGVHSKVQVACLVRGEDGPIGPVMLTVKSTVAKAFWLALRDHRNDVRAATGGKAPAYAFYWRFGAIGMEKTDEGGTVTSFGRIREGDFDPDAAYVGDEALDALDWAELETWADAWNGNGNGHKGNAAGSAPSGSASADQWDTITTLLDDVGYVTEETQAAAIVGAGYDPTSLSAQDAEALIKRLEAYKQQKTEKKAAEAK
jgi:hypothetical protein